MFTSYFFSAGIFFAYLAWRQTPYKTQRHRVSIMNPMSLYLYALCPVGI